MTAPSPFDDAGRQLLQDALRAASNSHSNIVPTDALDSLVVQLQADLPDGQTVSQESQQGAQPQAMQSQMGPSGGPAGPVTPY